MHLTVHSLVMAFGIHCALAASINEPPPGKVYLGAWLDTADSSVTAKDGDRPLLFNKRMAFNASVFQYAQNLPVDTYTFPIEQIEGTNTDALVYLTVYPQPYPFSIDDADIKALADQMAVLNAKGRKVLLRFGPEMNGIDLY